MLERFSLKEKTRRFRSYLRIHRHLGSTIITTESYMGKIGPPKDCQVAQVVSWVILLGFRFLPFFWGKISHVMKWRSPRILGQFSRELTVSWSKEFISSLQGHTCTTRLHEAPLCWMIPIASLEDMPLGFQGDFSENSSYCSWESGFGVVEIDDIHIFQVRWVKLFFFSFGQ